MNYGKMILQSVVFALLFVLVQYLIKTWRIKARFASVLGEGTLRDLFDQIDESSINPVSSYQEGCPRMDDILDAKNNGCFSSILPQIFWTDENQASAAVSSCFSPNDVLTEDLCSLTVLELRNQIDILHGIDMISTLDDDPATALMKGCYLDSDLWDWMNEYYEQTDNGFLLGQFGYTES